MSEKTTFTGHRGLELREDLIFEIGARDRSGVDLAPFGAYVTDWGVSLARRLICPVWQNRRPCATMCG